MKTRLAGQSAERRAERYLRSRGFTLVTRNYRCKAGEIDLIMQADDLLAFIEVRLRSGTSHGSGADSVTLSKQQKLIRTAEHFLQRHDAGHWQSFRFDVVSMDGDSNLDWIPGAFTLD